MTNRCLLTATQLPPSSMVHARRDLDPRRRVREAEAPTALRSAPRSPPSGRPRAEPASRQPRDRELGRAGGRGPPAGQSAQPAHGPTSVTYARRMTDVVIVDAVRTPDRAPRRRPVHRAPGRPARRTSSRRSSSASGIDPAEVGQVVGGCVSQVGEQSFNIARTAWLAAGLPLDGRRHHGRHAVRLVASRPPTWPPSLVGAGVVDVAVACGVEVDEPHPDRHQLVARSSASACRSRRRTSASYEMTSQFEGAERIADKWGITRERHRRASACASQQRAARAWAEGRFDGQWIAVDAPDLDEDGKPTGTTHTVAARRGPPRDVAREAGRR